MRIAFVTNGSFEKHATLKRATGMAVPLAVAGHEVDLLLLDSPVNREKVMQECPEAQVHWFSSTLSAWSERRIKQLFLNEIQPDLVWICGVGLRNLVKRPNRKCRMLADHSELYSNFSSGFARRLFFMLLEWSVCWLYDGQICASRYLEGVYRRRMRWFLRSKRVFYSPYAFHPEVIKSDAVAALSIKKKFKDKKIVLFMGSFWENYGFWDMLKACRKLITQRDDFVFILAGKGPEKEAGQAWVQSHGLAERIQLQGYIPEEQLSAYFSAASVFLSPLRDTIQDWARCPSKLFMYLPFKRPVITCAIGEAYELFGRNGLYYEPGNVASLVSTLREVLDSDGTFNGINPEDHTYKARTIEFLKWLEQVF